ncbi:uncharacterized protein LOC115280942 isoform X3 [Suricata suricatta]|uniref:uncharacterized protein LOC115280942 isoform X3 n=1 Tax=Suricata suricatta TaxID=37032 RepID=UPI001155C03D|nr:uncharacterized protein LOC115280942 isoform X3 [Suricata suricatta]
MSQRPQSGPQSTKPSFLPAASSNTQNETEVSPPITYRPRVSIQGFQPITNSDQVSIQEPLSIIHNHHVQDPPLVHGCWASTQDAPPIINSGWISTEDTPSTMNSHQLSIQDTSSVTYSHRFSTRDVPPISQNHHFSIQNSPLLSQETNIESLIYSGSQVISQDHLPTNQSPCSSTQCLISPIQAKVDASPSITHISTASIKSLDSTIWTSQESSKDTMDSFLGNPSTLDNNVQSIQSNRSAKMDSGRCQRKSTCSQSQLPLGWRLLHRAKKISHQCPDISCLHEYDQNAYLLDFAWAFLILASITSICLCILLLNIIFFTSSNTPTLDFSNGILGILTGFLSYLNYMNFWSILALQAT